MSNNIKKYEQNLENMKYLYNACIKENKNLTEQSIDNTLELNKYEFEQAEINSTISINLFFKIRATINDIEYHKSKQFTIEKKKTNAKKRQKYYLIFILILILILILIIIQSPSETLEPVL